jgi:major vault protein
MSNERTGDIILAQGTFVYVQDGASGQVDVIVGPNKISLADTDKPVTYDPNQRRYHRASTAMDAIQTFPTANEGEYIVLTNPNKGDNIQHPIKGKQQSPDLYIGHKINIPGPYTMALFPGQIGNVIPGHQLKSNEYLLVRVYNEDAAKKNLKNAIIKTNDEAEEQKKNSTTTINEKDIAIGKLFIIKGTDVSFYIPPTGIEVLKDNDSGKYVRKAVTLERLEYCILLDQNGDKRFVEGPSVVFPKPTETFVEQNGNTKFKAIELNDNMGIYVKVIADYEDYKSGDELFITGKQQKIYFPRPEHAIIKYGDQVVHYAVAVPAGEARYMLDKSTGEVKTVKGPSMLLPDPRKEVIVKRVLDDRTVDLWFPGNHEAKDYNSRMKAAQGISGSEGPTGLFAEYGTADLRAKSTVRFSAVADELQRSEKFTKPRTITLDTKYEGAICINVWPGYAVQIVKKTGERSVVEGPKVALLDFDETLEVLALSTGKPKTDNTLFRTVYLQTDNNIVSDVINAETKDAVNVSIRLSYRVNFDGDNKKWFSVSNYVKLLTQHLRSVVRNAVKKTTIEEFNLSATDIIRDLILGKNEDSKRPGRTFEENGMVVYDVEVLNIEIGDSGIAEMLRRAQQNTVKHNLDMQSKQQELEYTTKTEEIMRKQIEEKNKTNMLKYEIQLKEIQEMAKNELAKLNDEKNRQDGLDEIAKRKLAREKAEADQELFVSKAESDIRVNETVEKAKAVDPKMVEALMAISTVSFTETLAKNLKVQNGGLGDMFAKGSFDGLMETIKGTPLESKIRDFIKNNSTQEHTAAN